MKNILEAINNFVNFYQNLKSESLIYKRYYYHNKKLYEYLILKKWNWIGIEDIELVDVLNFFNYYKTSKTTTWPRKWELPTRNSLYNMVVSVRMFFRYLAMIGLKLKFNWEQIPIFRMEDIKREPMSKEDYEILRQAPILYHDPDRKDIILRDQLIFDIPRETWLRRAELVQLKFEDFHNENRQFKILVKWWRYESVFFSESLQKKVLKYEEIVREKYKFHENLEYLFFYMWNKQKWQHIRPASLWWIVKDYVRRLKEDWRISKDKKLCLHMERHSFAMKCVYSWLSQQATTALMRHKDPKITLHYYHLNDSWLLNQYDLIR